MIYTLRNDVVNKTSRGYDFNQGYGDTWEIAVPLTDEEMDNQDWMPMMNYLYPLPDDFEVPSDVKDKLNNMTIVYFPEEEQYYLALTGGGMDMTWDIAETYINLGYYPPTQYCDLPAMSGKGESPKDKKIIRYCNESLNLAKGWLESTRRRLRDVSPKKIKISSQNPSGWHNEPINHALAGKGIKVGKNRAKR